MSDGWHAKMSRFSWRNSTSALSYLGDRFIPIEVVLEASPATRSTYFVSTVGLKLGGEAETSCLDAGISVGSVAAWISLNSSPKNTGFRKGGFSVLALLDLPKAAIKGDVTIRSWHLQLIVDVAWPGMETMEGGASEDHMVCTLERNHLEGYGLFVVIIYIAEGNLEGDGPEGLSLAARNHYVESDSTMVELGLGEA
jgi:hypothetical protein